MKLVASEKKVAEAKVRKLVSACLAQSYKTLVLIGQSNLITRKHQKEDKIQNSLGNIAKKEI